MKGEVGEKQKINKINLDAVENPLCPRKLVEEEGPCSAEEKSGGEGQAQYSPNYQVSRVWLPKSVALT